MTRVPASTTGSHGPRVSVCIPVRNGADYIAEALESVLAQTFGDFELLAGTHGVGRMALKLAAAMYAPIVVTPGFLRATAGSLAGRGGVRFYQRIKALGKAV